MGEQKSTSWVEETLQIFCLLKKREHLQLLQNTVLPKKNSLPGTGLMNRGPLKVLTDQGILKTHSELTWYRSEISEVPYSNNKKLVGTGFLVALYKMD